VDVKHGRFVRHALDARGDYQAELIDQPGMEQGAIGCATTLQQQAANPQFMAQRLQRRREVDLPGSGAIKTIHGLVHLGVSGRRW
jgi:hypothetical protein